MSQASSQHYSQASAATSVRAQNLRPFLEKEVAILPGGRDIRGGSIIIIANLDTTELKLPQDNDTLLVIIQYLCNVPADQVRKCGFTFIIDMHTVDWSKYAKPILKLLNDCNNISKEFTVNDVFILKSNGFFENQRASLSSTSKYSFNVRLVDQLVMSGSAAENNILLKTSSSSSNQSGASFIVASQVPIEYGGTLTYKHDLWLDLRCQYELFIDEATQWARELEKQRNQTLHAVLPESLQKADEKLVEHEARAKAYERRYGSAVFDKFMQQGRQLATKLSGNWTLEKDGTPNPDFVHDVGEIEKYLNCIQKFKHELLVALDKRAELLNHCRFFYMFEMDMNKVLQCIYTKRDELLNTFTDIGDSCNSAVVMWEQHKKYRTECEALLPPKITKYCNTAVAWIRQKHYAEQQLSEIVNRVDSEWRTLEDALRDRERVLELSVKFHAETEQFLSKVPHWRQKCDINAALGFSNMNQHHQQQQQHGVSNGRVTTNGAGVAADTNNSNALSTTVSTNGNQQQQQQQQQQRALISDRTSELEILRTRHDQLHHEMDQQFNNAHVASKELMFRLNLLFRQRILEQRTVGVATSSNGSSNSGNNNNNNRKNCNNVRGRHAAVTSAAAASPAPAPPLQTVRCWSSNNNGIHGAGSVVTPPTRQQQQLGVVCGTIPASALSSAAAVADTHTYYSRPQFIFGGVGAGNNISANNNNSQIIQQQQQRVPIAVAESSRIVTAAATAAAMSPAPSSTTTGVDVMMIKCDSRCNYTSSSSPSSCCEHNNNNHDVLKTHKLGNALYNDMQSRCDSSSTATTAAAAVASCAASATSSSSASSGAGEMQQHSSSSNNGVGGYTKGATHVLQVQQEINKRHKELMHLWNENHQIWQRHWAVETFREDAYKVLEWIKDKGEPYMQKNCEVGKSLQRAQRLRESQTQFLFVALNTLGNAEMLLNCANQYVIDAAADGMLDNQQEIEREKHCLEVHVQEFSRRVQQREELVNCSLRFHEKHSKLQMMLHRIEPLLQKGRDEYPNTFEECESLIAGMEREKKKCFEHLHDTDTDLSHLINLLNAELASKNNNSATRSASTATMIEELAFLNGFSHRLQEKKQTVSALWNEQSRSLHVVLNFRQFENNIIEFISSLAEFILFEYQRRFQEAGLPFSFDAVNNTTETMNMLPPPPMRVHRNNHNHNSARRFGVMLFANNNNNGGGMPSDEREKEQNLICGLRAQRNQISNDGQCIAKDIRNRLAAKQAAQQQLQHNIMVGGARRLNSSRNGVVGGGDDIISPAVESINSNSTIEEAIAQRIDELQMLADQHLQTLARAFERRLQLEPHILRLKALVDDCERAQRGMNTGNQMLNDCNVLPLDAAELRQLDGSISNVKTFIESAGKAAENILRQRDAFYAADGPRQLNLSTNDSLELCVVHDALVTWDRLGRRFEELRTLSEHAREFQKTTDGLNSVLLNFEREYRQYNSEDARTTLAYATAAVAAAAAAAAAAASDAENISENGAEYLKHHGAKQMQLALQEVAKHLQRHAANKVTFKNACTTVRLTADKFRKTVRRNINLMYDETSTIENSQQNFAAADNTNNKNDAEIKNTAAAAAIINEKLKYSQHKINDIVDRLVNLEVRVMHAWDERQTRLEELQRYISFEISARKSLDWIDEHGEQCLQKAQQQQKNNNNTDSASMSSATSVFDVEQLLRDQGQKVEKIIELANKLSDNGQHLYASNIQHWVMQVSAKYEDFAQRLEKYRNNNNAAAVEVPAAKVSAAAPSSQQPPRSKPTTQRDYIIRELIQTEQIYCKDLHDCMRTYLTALRTDASVSDENDENENAAPPPQLIRHKEYDIFGNLEQIYEFHSQTLLPELRRYEASTENVGHCFAMWEQRFDLYIEYCKNKQRSMDLILAGGQQVAGYFESIQRKHNLTEAIGSYLIKPVQRIMKYPLLLSELIKASSSSAVGGGGSKEAASRAIDDDEGLSAIRRVLTKTQNVMNLASVTFADAGNNDADQFGDVLLFDSFFMRDPVVVAANDMFVGDDYSYGGGNSNRKQNKKLAQFARRSKADHERAVFLCERMLLVCKNIGSTSITSDAASSTPRYQAKLKIPTSSLISVMMPELAINHSVSSVDGGGTDASASSLIITYSAPRTSKQHVNKRIVLHSSSCINNSNAASNNGSRTMSTWFDELGKIIEEFGIRSSAAAAAASNNNKVAVHNRKRITNATAPVMRIKPATAGGANKSTRSSVSSGLSDTGTNNTSAYDADDSTTTTNADGVSISNATTSTIEDMMSTNGDGDNDDADNLSEEIINVDNCEPHERTIMYKEQPPPPLQLNKESIKRQLTSWFKQPLKKLGHSMSSVESQYVQTSHQLQHHRSSVHEHNNNNNNNGAGGVRSATAASSSKRFSWDSQQQQQPRSSATSSNSNNNSNNDLLMPPPPLLDADGVSLASSSNAEIELPPPMTLIQHKPTMFAGSEINNNNNINGSNSAVATSSSSSAAAVGGGGRVAVVQPLLQQQQHQQQQHHSGDAANARHAASSSDQQLQGALELIHRLSLGEQQQQQQPQQAR